MIDGHAGDAAKERPSISGHVEMKVYFWNSAFFISCSAVNLVPSRLLRATDQVGRLQHVRIPGRQYGSVLYNARQYGSVSYNAKNIKQSETIWVSIIQCERDNIRQSETMSDMIMRESVRQRVCILAR